MANEKVIEVVTNAEDIAKKIKLHKDYLKFENKLVEFNDLSEEAQKYVKGIKKEYDAFIKGKIPYNSLSEDAKFKADNKVARAYMRRKITETNSQINGIARTTNGYQPLSADLLDESLATATINKAINNSFEKVFKCEPDLNYLSIYGLSVLNQFKQSILNIYEPSKFYYENQNFDYDYNYNSKIFKECLETVQDLFKTNLKNNKIDLDEIYFLHNKVDATDAKRILEHLSAEDLSACLENCKYNKVAPELEQLSKPKSKTKTNESVNISELLYFDDIYGNPLNKNDENYTTQTGERYVGDVYILNTNLGDGDEYEYYETVEDPHIQLDENAKER